MTTNTSRRNFLKKGAILSGGLMISFVVPGVSRLKGAAVSADTDFVPNAYLRVGIDDSVHVVLAHSEMGQGIWTTLTMLIAEELDADWSKIQVEHSPAGDPYRHTAFGIQITGGSSTTWSEFDRYRKAGATARVLLVSAAAKKFGVSESECRTENGWVIAGTKRASYGELSAAASTLPPPKDVPLRGPKDWKYIGKGAKRLDAPAKVNGTAKFGMDMQFPGMLTAVMAHPPVYGSKVKSFDATKAKAIPGVRDVVQVSTGVAVIADHFWAAKKGRDALKIEWINSAIASFDSVAQLAEFRQLAGTRGLPAAQKGDVNSAMSKAVKTVEAEYSFPYLAHAPMEPINCTVKIENGQCEIWTGSQMQMTDQEAAAKVLGFKTEQVNMHTVFLGGGFGRRATPTSDFVVEAVEIAKNSGKFIKMVWTREDDIRGGYYRPSFVHRAKIGLDAAGMPIAWDHTIVGQSIMGGAGPFAAMIKNGIDPTSVEGVSDSPYMEDVPDHYVGLHTTTTGMPVLWFRSVGHTHTASVMETLVDELAHTAGKDPVEYRRTLLKKHPRHLAALNLVAEKANWGQSLPEGHFNGVAVHESFGSYVAQVAEVSIDANGLVKVHKVVCAIDCGLAVNPDGVRAQMESGINFGVAVALYGEITLEKGHVKQSNFHDYRVARMSETPVIEVHIVDSTDKMGGAGECGVPPTAPAIANAVFAATGKRLRQQPFGNINLKA
ncbi:isoquinoline 1-oxidoreductase, beta subunit [Chitinophaga sp. CF118]|uniref:xanthine dehydrogenase family protein molybdopterin-binding subunit n=1 Tax=Chitinophaga sp. CF118 TaxID=1884367 RepID=UPI0008F26D89|nr:xanthine dehydrogenase family protein molybdopterin-binding subunit [Chitinophaga sp. CF118]SFD01608.1 isoquinoline 1-oxidoreductase, beta subunit [Chitinophaga sp. CF118]